MQMAHAYLFKSNSRIICPSIPPTKIILAPHKSWCEENANRSDSLMSSIPFPSPNMAWLWWLFISSELLQFGKGSDMAAWMHMRDKLKSCYPFLIEDPLQNVWQPCPETLLWKWKNVYWVFSLVTGAPQRWGRDYLLNSALFRWLMNREQRPSAS